MRLPFTEVVQTADHGAFRPSLPWLLSALLLAVVLAVPFVLVDVPPMLETIEPLPLIIRTALFFAATGHVGKSWPRR